MSQPFSFPPPPPAPPKRQSASITEPRGNFGGRGSHRGQHSNSTGYAGRGRGFHNSQNSHRARGSHGYKSSSPPPKRDFATAFANQPQPRPKAPPAVPSFNVDVKSLLLPKPSSQKGGSTQRKGNLLGLTPTTEDVSESEDDLDEDTKLAAAYSGDGLQFEHRGQTHSLRTSADIAAWIAERKKKFPTQAKAAAAKKEAAERKKQWEERQRVRTETIKAQREQREQERKEREKQKLKEKLIAAQVAKSRSVTTNNTEDIALKAKQKADRLRRKAERAVRDLQEAEEELKRSEEKAITVGSGETIDASSDILAEFSSELLSASDSDSTSSSGSSGTDTDSDSEPEQSTTKRSSPERVPPPKQSLRNDSSNQSLLCKNMVKFGKCKYGKSCRFSHKIVKEKVTKNAPTSARRKGLYQIMVEKEQKEVMERALQAIIVLGDQGMLNSCEEKAASNT